MAANDPEAAMTTKTPGHSPERVSGNVAESKKSKSVTLGPSHRLNYWAMVKAAGLDWFEDNAMRLAAALAFYTALSIAPLLVIAIKVVGIVFSEKAATGQVRAYAIELMGHRAGSALAGMIGPMVRPGSGILATIISVVVLIVSASAVFAELQDALNTVWEVKPKPGRPYWAIIRERFLSFVLVMGTCFLLLVSLIVSTVLAALTGALLGGDGGPLLNVASFVFSTAVITLLFALIFKYLPDVKIKWRDVWVGAAVTGLLFAVGKLVLGWYLGRASTTSVYGAAGSLIAMLLWVYYSAQILFFGAEITQVYARRTHSRIKPTDNAVRVTQEERANQGIPSPERVEAASKGQPLSRDTGA